MYLRTKNYVFCLTGCCLERGRRNERPAGDDQTGEGRKEGAGRSDGQILQVEDRQTDKQTNRQTDKQTNRQTDKQIHQRDVRQKSIYLDLRMRTERRIYKTSMNGLELKTRKGQNCP